MHKNFYGCLLMLSGEYEWHKCLWIRSNFPKENLALAEKSSCSVTENTKTVNVPFIQV